LDNNLIRFFLWDFHFLYPSQIVASKQQNYGNLPPPSKMRFKRVALAEFAKENQRKSISRNLKGQGQQHKDLLHALHFSSHFKSYNVACTREERLVLNTSLWFILSLFSLLSIKSSHSSFGVGASPLSNLFSLLLICTKDRDKSTNNSNNTLESHRRRRYWVKHTDLCVK
jgi:hypothetical protein